MSVVILTFHAEQIRTTVTDLLKINHPIMLAGMNVAAGPKLAAAVTNAGGLGVIGGLGYSPDMLRSISRQLPRSTAVSILTKVPGNKLRN